MGRARPEVDAGGAAALLPGRTGRRVPSRRLHIRPSSRAGPRSARTAFIYPSVASGPVIVTRRASAHKVAPLPRRGGGVGLGPATGGTRRRRAGWHHPALDAARPARDSSNGALALESLEAPPGFEPGNEGFADLCLTTWRRCRSGSVSTGGPPARQRARPPPPERARTSARATTTPRTRSAATSRGSSASAARSRRDSGRSTTSSPAGLLLRSTSRERPNESASVAPSRSRAASTSDGQRARERGELRHRRELHAGLAARRVGDRRRALLVARSPLPLEPRRRGSGGRARAAGPLAPARSRSSAAVRAQERVREPCRRLLRPALARRRLARHAHPLLRGRPQGRVGRASVLHRRCPGTGRKHRTFPSRRASIRRPAAAAPRTGGGARADPFPGRRVPPGEPNGGSSMNAASPPSPPSPSRSPPPPHRRPPAPPGLGAAHRARRLPPRRRPRRGHGVGRPGPGARGEARPAAPERALGGHRPLRRAPRSARTSAT